MCMSKLQKNMLEAAQPRPPPMYQLLKYMHDAANGQNDTEERHPENLLFPEEYRKDDSTVKQYASLKNEARACKMGLEYQKVVDGENAALDDVDDWFCGLGKFLLHPHLLHDDPAQQELCLDNKHNSKEP